MEAGNLQMLSIHITGMLQGGDLKLRHNILTIESRLVALR